MYKIFAVLFLLSVFTPVLFSQKFDSTKTVLITLTDETEIVGRIIKQDSLNTTIRSFSGVVSVVPKNMIAGIKRVRENIVEKEYFPPDPADNRIMALPSGRSLKAGQVQFNAVELIFPHLVFGVTDNVNIGFGGLPFVSGGGGTLVYYLTAKVTPINFKEAGVSLGGAIVGTTSSNDIVGVGYAVGTFGNSMSSVTVGPFFAFSKDEVFDRPAILLGGQFRISKGATFLTENVFLFGNETEEFYAFPSIGVRFSGEKLAADFGTYAVVSKDHFFYPIPWIGLSYKF